MAKSNLARRRLRNQLVAQQRFATPAEVVSWLGAVQAQDYLGALWALGLRLPRSAAATEAGIERALAAREIVRTWPMRGTLHFVAAADARWLLALLAPRVLASRAWVYRELGLSPATLARAGAAVARALEGGKQLLRAELMGVLDRARCSTAGWRGLHLVGYLAQSGLICFGARQGKQQTFALLEEWLPPAQVMPRDQALGELARRYFASHGPATLRDLVWWSGLRVADARSGLEMAAPALDSMAIAGQTYWEAPVAPRERTPAARAFLLPPYDEYLVGYRDRAAAVDPRDAQGGGWQPSILSSPVIVIDGRVRGTWKRTLEKNAVVLPVAARPKLTRAERQALAVPARRYADFVGLPLEWA